MSLPWNRIFHELNLTPLINKMNELAQTVEQLASQIVTVNNPRITIKQGGETKGSFTLNQSSAQTINLDAGGGGGSEYTAGTGIDITNNVISVINAIIKTQLNFDDAVIPCLMINTNDDSSVLLKLDGTNATLADCLDLGASSLDLGAQFLKHSSNVTVSGTCKVYDYGTQTQTSYNYNQSPPDNTGQIYLFAYNLFPEGVQILADGISAGGTNLTLKVAIGKANDHLYAFLVNQVWSELTESNYIDSCTLSADIEFTQI